MPIKPANFSSKNLSIFAERLSFYQQKFNPEFKQFFKTLPKKIEYPQNSTFTPLAINLIEDLSLRGGKRQRVAFLYETCKLFNFSVKPQPLKISAISIELLQTHLLIHDDLVDNSPLRRGQPTTHRQFQQWLKANQQPENQVAGLTIFTGDLAAYLAIAVLSQVKLPAKQVLELIDIQLQVGLNTFVGQIFDLERDQGNFSDQDLFTLADFKAIRSSVFAPMLIGLILSGQNNKRNQERIKRYGYLIGVAGQLQDDLLGLFGQEKVIGKSNLSDLIEGKKTLLVKYALSTFNQKQTRQFNKIFGQAKATRAEFAIIKKMIQDSGAMEKVKNIAKKFAEQAKQEALGWQDWRPEARAFFIGAAEWAIIRKL